MLLFYFFLLLILKALKAILIGIEVFQDVSHFVDSVGVTEGNLAPWDNRGNGLSPERVGSYAKVTLHVLDMHPVELLIIAEHSVDAHDVGRPLPDVPDGFLHSLPPSSTCQLPLSSSTSQSPASAGLSSP